MSISDVIYCEISSPLKGKVCLHFLKTSNVLSILTIQSTRVFQGACVSPANVGQQITVWWTDKRTDRHTECLTNDREVKPRMCQSAYPSDTKVELQCNAKLNTNKWILTLKYFFFVLSLLKSKNNKMQPFQHTAHYEHVNTNIYWFPVWFPELEQNQCNPCLSSAMAIGQRDPLHVVKGD